jgi:signal transduction histidine kinase
MTESRVFDAPRPPPASPIAAVGSLVAARDLEELVQAAALTPSQLLGARDTVVVLQAAGAEIVQSQPAGGGGELERWARAELGQGLGQRVSRRGSYVAVGIEPVDGWSGVLALSVGSVDDETTSGLEELGRVISRCVAQLAGLQRRAAALEDTRKSIGKGLHDLRTPLNSLRLGLHLLQPGLAGQDPQVVQRTHRAVDRLAALVTEMYETLHENTEPR